MLSVIIIAVIVLITIVPGEQVQEGARKPLSAIDISIYSSTSNKISKKKYMSFKVILLILYLCFAICNKMQ